jgi:hypothetical protein
MLYRCVAGSRYSVTDLHAAVQWFVGHSNVVLIDPISNDHAFDAALSAWATRQGYESGWQDLVIQEANPIFPAGEVNYLWPPVKK